MTKILKKDFVKTGFFALFVSAVLLVVVFEIQKFKEEEEVKETQNRVLNFDPESVKRLSLEGHTVIKNHDQGVWRTVAPITDYLNFQAVDDLIAKAFSFDGRKLSDEDETVNWAEFGFTDKSPSITFFSGKDSYKLQISQKKAFDESVYLKYKKNNEAEVLMTSNPDWSGVFDQKIKDLRSFKVFDWRVPEPKGLATVIKVKRKNKESLSFVRDGGVWLSETRPKWTLSKVKIDAFLSDIRQYVHKGFADGKMRLGSPLVSLYVGDQKKNDFSVNLYMVDKKVYAVSSYRPEHVLAVDKESLEDFVPEAVDFRSFSDLAGGYEAQSIQAVKIRKNGENKVFRLKNNIWTKTDGKKIPKGFEFNGAKVFKVFETFQKIQYKRYISDKDVLFKSAKKKLYFYKDPKKIDLTYSVGQRFPCSFKSKGSRKCILVATNKVQGYYGVALRTEVEKIFKIGFVKRRSKAKKGEDK